MLQTLEANGAQGGQAEQQLGEPTMGDEQTWLLACLPFKNFIQFGSDFVSKILVTYSFPLWINNEGAHAKTH